MHTIARQVLLATAMLSVIGCGTPAAKSAGTTIVNGPLPPVARVSVGDAAACIIATTGELYCWGELPGSTWDQSGTWHIPTRIGSDADWNDVAVSVGEICGVKASGALWCWGSLSGSPSPAPWDAGGSGTYQRVYAGSLSMCALTTEGRLFCWGNNSSGGLGTGSVVGVDQPAQPPREVVGGGDWTQISPGDWVDGTLLPYWCGIRDLRIACWGGEYGTSPDRGPQLFKPAAGKPWKSVAKYQLSNEYESTTICAVRTNGELWCGGDNSAGQLGLGRTTPMKRCGSEISSCTLDGFSPGAVAKFQRIGKDVDWDEVFIGGLDTCATKTDHTVWCWGVAGSETILDKPLASPDSRLQPQPAPMRQVLLDGNTTWLQYARGGLTACLVSASHKLYCYGDNSSGQLGTPAGRTQNPVDISLQRSLVEIAQARVVSGNEPSPSDQPSPSLDASPSDTIPLPLIEGTVKDIQDYLRNNFIDTDWLPYISDIRYYRDSPRVRVVDVQLNPIVTANRKLAEDIAWRACNAIFGYWSNPVWAGFQPFEVVFIGSGSGDVYRREDFAHGENCMN